ncbi:unnamed protein product [Polarella glacialis]|uniref:Uncharacterized protein n=1 Tax=Polarella glacialis TaxID=89957 RepID=A0A813FK16_POLGL|nr:unnamed protein product [Polarella glacialis]
MPEAYFLSRRTWQVTYGLQTSGCNRAGKMTKAALISEFGKPQLRLAIKKVDPRSHKPCPHKKVDPKLAIKKMDPKLASIKPKALLQANRSSSLWLSVQLAEDSKTTWWMDASSLQLRVEDPNLLPEKDWCIRLRETTPNAPGSLEVVECSVLSGDHAWMVDHVYRLRSSQDNLCARNNASTLIVVKCDSKDVQPEQLTWFIERGHCSIGMDLVDSAAKLWDYSVATSAGTLEKELLIKTLHYEPDLRRTQAFDNETFRLYVTSTEACLVTGDEWSLEVMNGWKILYHTYHRLVTKPCSKLSGDQGLFYFDGGRLRDKQRDQCLDKTWTNLNKTITGYDSLGMKKCFPGKAWGPFSKINQLWDWDGDMLLTSAG